MERLEYIRNLLEQLSVLGYHPFQIEQIIAETIETTKLDSLLPQEQEQLANSLEEYVKFALKCRSVPRARR
jgi:hypothetical protein